MSHVERVRLVNVGALGEFVVEGRLFDEIFSVRHGGVRNEEAVLTVNPLDQEAPVN